MKTKILLMAACVSCVAVQAQTATDSVNVDTLTEVVGIVTSQVPQTSGYSNLITAVVSAIGFMIARALEKRKLRKAGHLVDGK